MKNPAKAVVLLEVREAGPFFCAAGLEGRFESELVAGAASLVVGFVSFTGLFWRVCTLAALRLWLEGADPERDEPFAAEGRGALLAEDALSAEETLRCVAVFFFGAETAL